MAPSVDDIREQLDVAYEHVEEITADLPSIPTVDLSAVSEFLSPESEFIPPSHLSVNFTLLGGNLPQAKSEHPLIVTDAGI